MRKNVFILVGTASFGALLSVGLWSSNVKAQSSESVVSRGVTMLVEGTEIHGADYDAGITISPLIQRLGRDEVVRAVTWKSTIRNAAGQHIVDSVCLRYVHPDSSVPLRDFGATFVGAEDPGKLGIGSFGFYFEIDPNGSWRNASDESITTRLVIDPVADEQAWMEWVSANRPE